jgi:hypothetical protein
VRLIIALSLVVGLVSVSPAAFGEETAQCVSDMIGHAPAPVAAYVRRYQTCLRWNGDEAMSAQQAHSPRTPARIRALNCDRLAHDGQVLRKRYARDPGVISALDESDRTLC